MKRLEKTEHINFFVLLENQGSALGGGGGGGGYNFEPENMFSGIKSHFSQIFDDSRE